MRLWDSFLNDIESKLGKEAVDKWLRPLKVAGFDARNIYLDTTDPFLLQWFKEHVVALAKERFLAQNGQPIKIHLKTPAKKENKPKQQESAPDFPPDTLNPEMTFETLLLDKNNLAHNLVSQMNSKELALGAFNPVTVTGPTGSGKTHLLMALAHSLKAQGKNVRYIRGKTFTEQVVRAFRFGGVMPFRGTYRNLDVLIIDGIDTFSRKWATQEELFHTFNTLHTEGKQIILSSPKIPTQLEDIEERLISRFEWGINAPTTAPDMTLFAKTLLARQSFTYDENLIDFLISSFSETKALAKAITALSLRLKGYPVLDIEIAEKTLSDLIAAEQRVVLTEELIVKAVAKWYDIKEQELIGKGQKKELAKARQMAMYLCRRKLKLPFPQIGRYFSRDHSTVMSSCKLVERELEKEKGSLQTPLEEIEKLLL